jgi:hypothetical protein
MSKCQITSQKMYLCSLVNGEMKLSGTNPREEIRNKHLITLILLTTVKATNLKIIKDTIKGINTNHRALRGNLDMALIIIMGLIMLIIIIIIIKTLSSRVIITKENRVQMIQTLIKSN